MNCAGYWREQPDAGEPVGARIDFWGQLVTVVGIVGDIKDGPTNAEARPAAFFPIIQWPRRGASVVLRTHGDPNGLVGQLRDVVSGLAALGLVLGLAASLALARLLVSLLFGVTPFDLLTFLGVAAGVIVVAGVSCLLPAVRAARVEPARAMK